MTVKPVLTTTCRLNFAINPTAILSSIQVKVVIPSINDDDPTAEYDLTSGRITKLPVSWFFTTKLTVAGAHNLIFHSNCTDADSDAGRCDTGLLVWEGSNTYYNDDDPLPAAHGNGKRGSYIQIPPRNQSKEYSIALFSRIRATSFTTLYYNLDNGIAWQRLSSPMEVWGILVKVGSLLSGDGLDVATHTNGSGNDDTQIILFNPESQILRLTTLVLNKSISDNDPRIGITGNAWVEPNNYVLIGKSTTTATSNSGIETKVDLLHTPLSVTGSSSMNAGAATRVG